MGTLTIGEAESLARQALEASGAAPGSARSTARALVAAEIDGQAGHGLSRVPSYAEQLRSGKVDGRAVPSCRRVARGAVRIDAAGGFAYPALDLAVEALPGLARECGVAVATLHRSHHIGQAGYTAERLAQRSCLGLICSNTPRAMPFPGGMRPMMGTNPLAFAAPLPDRAPLVIDLALSQVARSRIVAAQKAGEAIPPEWATDCAGQPTPDPTAALAGALTPAGGVKGASLALIVEILCSALAGGHYGWEASSFLDGQGPPPGVGQVLLAFDTQALSAGEFPGRMSDLLAAVAAESGIRLPGDSRIARRARAAAHGLEIDAKLHASLTALVNGAEAVR